MTQKNVRGSLLATNFGLYGLAYHSHYYVSLIPSLTGLLHHASTFRGAKKYPRKKTIPIPFPVLKLNSTKTFPLAESTKNAYWTLFPK